MNIHFSLKDDKYNNCKLKLAEILLHIEQKGKSKHSIPGSDKEVIVTRTLHGLQVSTVTLENGLAFSYEVNPTILWTQ